MCVVFIFFISFLFPFHMMFYGNVLFFPSFSNSKWFFLRHMYIHPTRHVTGEILYSDSERGESKKSLSYFDVVTWRINQEFNVLWKCYCLFFRWQSGWGSNCWSFPGMTDEFTWLTSRTNSCMNPKSNEFYANSMKMQFLNLMSLCRFLKDIVFAMQRMKK